MNNPAPLSKRQYAYFMRCFSSWFNVAEGGKRGGKNVLQTMIFCAMLENHPNKIHLVAGVSNATAKLNILDCDGYGLLNYFEGRCREGKYKDRDCVYVQTKTGEKIVLVSGGGKDGDEKLIKGNTYGMFCWGLPVSKACISVKWTWHCLRCVPGHFHMMQQ